MKFKQQLKQPFLIYFFLSLGQTSWASDELMCCNQDTDWENLGCWKIRFIPPRLTLIGICQPSECVQASLFYVNAFHRNQMLGIPSLLLIVMLIFNELQLNWLLGQEPMLQGSISQAWCYIHEINSGIMMQQNC